MTSNATVVFQFMIYSFVIPSGVEESRSIIVDVSPGFIHFDRNDGDVSLGST